ncbi:preprotein translocase subunit TatA [Halorubrum distributum]|uniref:Preprotein translocase subunit TatA n=1 Tax=Halorubrum distributum TaxID=29283 RepID=A0A6B1J044_9EURY|nr:preprotein translocase subunit TatA [Halorubrum terrestre]MYL17968.1 preprotein translocase subunit TatA [Halorubrum terrestre]MYL69065.1 preprotein translocase subunit TatA [Halorubrum terrestre]
MVSLVPAFGGVPGGPELIIILVIAVVLFGVPLVLVAGAVVYLATRSEDEAANAETADSETADDDRIAELEKEVERLREQVGDEPDELEEEETESS